MRWEESHFEIFPKSYLQFSWSRTAMFLYCFYLRSFRSLVFINHVMNVECATCFARNPPIYHSKCPISLKSSCSYCRHTYSIAADASHLNRTVCRSRSVICPFAYSHVTSLHSPFECTQILYANRLWISLTRQLETAMCCCWFWLEWAPSAIMKLKFEQICEAAASFNKFIHHAHAFALCVRIWLRTRHNVTTFLNEESARERKA